MLLATIAAGALATAQPGGGTPFETFDDTIPGWNVNRRPDGCFAFTTADVAETSLNIFYKLGDDGQSLNLLFSSTGLRVDAGDSLDYRLQFGRGGDWLNLPGHSFADGASGDGVIAFSFHNQEIRPMLADLSRSSHLNLSRAGQPLRTIGLDNSAVAVRRLMDCVRTIMNPADGMAGPK